MHDPTCQDVAEYFLSEEPYTRETETIHEQRVEALAEAVQVAIEAWLDSNPPSAPVPGLFSFVCSSPGARGGIHVETAHALAVAIQALVQRHGQVTIVPYDPTHTSVPQGAHETD